MGAAPTPAPAPAFWALAHATPHNPGDNRAGDLDAAVVDRMDEALEFQLPGPQERRRILDLYFNQYIQNAGTAAGGAGAGASTGLWAKARDWMR